MQIRKLETEMGKGGGKRVETEGKEKEKWGTGKKWTIRDALRKVRGHERVPKRMEKEGG